MLLTRKADEAGGLEGDGLQGVRVGVGVGGNHVMRHANMAKTLAKQRRRLPHAVCL